MIKGIVLLFNLLGLFLCRLFFPVSVNVSQTAPYSAQVNNSFMVQVAINKGDLKGMAKFTEKLPVGLTAVPIDNQGAKTSFDNNTIQFSWDSLPGDGIMNISFRVDVSSSATGAQDTLTGKFFYMVDNQKLEADCMPSFINITGITVANISGSHQIDSIKQCQGGIFIQRRFPSSSIPPNGDAKITLIIHKAGIIGFAKVEDSLPPGFTAAAIDDGGASFSFVDNIAKFVWQSIPSDSVITISYRILAGSDVSGTHAVSGNFSYIYNSAPVSCSIGTTIFNTTVLPPGDSVKTPITPGGSVTSFPPIVNAASYPQIVADTSAKNAAVQTNQQPSSGAPSTSNNDATAPKPTNYLVITPSGNVVTNRADTVKNTFAQPAAKLSAFDSTVQAMNAKAAAVAGTPTNVTPSIPAPQTGLNYRVQLMALHNPVDVSYFSLHKHINIPVNTELIGGFTKYTVGNYSDYKTVRDAREDFRNRGIVGPFVVSYNSGTRITVQEALMISHQQWYK